MKARDASASKKLVSAQVKLVKTVEIVETVEAAKTVETVETVEIMENFEARRAVKNQTSILGS